ncbi:MAG TPA: hypothetical protein VIH52_04300 [Candidatus Nanoarchaeia archaeon]
MVVAARPALEVLEGHYSVEGAADRLGLPTETIISLIEERRMRGCRAFGLTLVPREDVIAYREGAGHTPLPFGAA